MDENTFSTPQYSTRQLNGFATLAKDMCALLPKENTPTAIESAHVAIKEKFGYDVDVFFIDDKPHLGFGIKTTDEILLRLGDSSL